MPHNPNQLEPCTERSSAGTQVPALLFDVNEHCEARDDVQSHWR
jgi:hypothetical protein